MDYKEHTGEAYIEVEYYTRGVYRFKKSKAKYTGIQGAIRNARVTPTGELILISKEEYYKEN